MFAGYKIEVKRNEHGNVNSANNKTQTIPETETVWTAMGIIFEPNVMNMEQMESIQLSTFPDWTNSLDSCS
jgi:hypothetical protein